MKYIEIHRLEFRDVGNGWLIGLIIFCICSIPSLLLPYPLDEGYIKTLLLIFIGYCIGVFFSLVEIKTYKVKVEEVKK